MALFEATLTLPGIAGFILTIGMAVDSNVLVFERIREELRAGRAPKAAIENGFSKAFATIIDTHATTIISALFLLQFGTGPVKGFAVTLIIGLLDLHVHGGFRVAHDLRARVRAPPAHRHGVDLRRSRDVMEFFRQTNIDFLKYKWWAIGASWALIAVGVFTIFVQKGLKFGIDFSGGTAIAVRFAERPDIDRLRKLLDGAGLGEIGIQRYEEAEKNSVLIRVQQQATEGRDVAGDVLKALRQGLQAPTDPGKIDINTEGRATLGGAPGGGRSGPGRRPARRQSRRLLHAGRRARSSRGARSSGSSARPRTSTRSRSISAPVKAWIKANTVAGPFVLLSAENVGPQVGADLQKKAILAIIWSTIGMLAYIAFRFRSLPFGVGAIVALIHDTLITIGILALLGREFNLVVVAALLTLVGYSVNDTVVVYDRVRENLKTPKKEPLEVVINRSINQTLSRTILTSGATMLVVIALFFLGGEVLNTFALTLIIGIIIGTYSSIYVAAAIVVIWKDFKNRRKLAVVPAPAEGSSPPPAGRSTAPPHGPRRSRRAGA